MRITRRWRQFFPIVALLLVGAAAARAQFTVVPSMLPFTSQGGQTAQPLDSTIQVSSSLATTTTVKRPEPQITVGGSGATLPFHVDTSGGSWLQVTPTDGSTDAILSVVASPTGLASGYYLGLITPSILGVAGSQQYVPVVFIVQ